MTKFAVFFIAALAVQATFAFPKYYEEGKLVSYLDEIQTEVKDLTLFLQNDFPEHHSAIKTMTWQCRQLAVVVDEIINKLQEEIFMHHEDGQHVFKQVTFMLKEIHSSLKKMVLFTDMTDVHEVKKHFIVCLESVFENIDKMVRLTYTSFPEFRFTLKYLLVDFMTTIRNIRMQCEYMMKDMDVENAPKHMVMKIHEYTRECTDVLKELNHPMQMKVALRGYLRYVREIMYHLESQTMTGEKEFDQIMHHLTNKLREIVYPLMELSMTQEMVDMEEFRTKMVSYFYDIVGIFEQMMQWMESKPMPVEIKFFVEKMIYHYCFAIKQVCNEIKFGFKIGFFTPEYYTMHFYGKYGYGLYEREFRERFMTPYKYVTEMCNTLFPMKYFMGKYEKMYKPMEMHSMTSEYEHQTPKELMMHMNMLTKKFFADFETMKMNPMTIRHFMTVLDYVIERMHEKVTGECMCDKKIMMEVFMAFKQMKMELTPYTSFDMHTNMEKTKMQLMEFVKMFTTHMEKLMMFEECRMEYPMLIKDICMRFMSFLHEMSEESTMYNHEYTNMHGLTGFAHTEVSSHKEMMMEMNMLTKKFFAHFETMKMNPMTIRRFVTVLDYVIERMHEKMTGESMCDKKMMMEVFMTFKQMKMELTPYTSFDMHTNMEKTKMHLMEFVKMFTMHMEKLMMFEDCRMEYPMLIKDICTRFMSFLHEMSKESTMYSHEYTNMHGLTGFVHTEVSSHKEMMMEMNMLTKKFFSHFETMKMNPMTIRRFVTVLDYVIERMHEKMTGECMCDKKIMMEVFMTFKQMKMELTPYTSFDMYINMEKTKMHLMEFVKMFTMHMEKLMMFEECRMEYPMLIKDICMRFMSFLHEMSKESTMYTQKYTNMHSLTGLPHTDISSYKQMMMRMNMLTKKFFESFETMKMTPMTMDYMHHFMTVLDYVIEHMHAKMTGECMCDKKMMMEVFMTFKQMKMDLEHFLSIDMSTNMDKMPMYFMQFIKMFTMQMEKLMMFEECRMEYPMLLKDMCMRYMTFLEELGLKMNKHSMEYLPIKNFRSMYHDVEIKTMMPFFYKHKMY